jgi:hypothetical protein
MNKSILLTALTMGQPLADDSTTSKVSIDWYKSLSIEQKINLKDCTHLIIGVEFKQIIKLFTLKEVIKILYDKLKLEGFQV